MSPVLEKNLSPAVLQPPRPVAGEANPRLNVAVIFTSVEATLAALKQAAELACPLNASLTLIVAQIVPYPLSLTSPPVPQDFSERRFRVIADQSHVETTVRIYLCRDPDVMLIGILKPHSLVVIGGTKRWWPTPERRLARKLRRAGHEVILTEN
jgi:hypothetical protein